MKTRMTIIMLGVVLLFAGIAGAQQILLPGALIPKFVDPLPVGSAADGTGITVVDATATGVDFTPNAGSPFSITAKEFQAQILPSTGVPLAGLPADTGSWVWGYLTNTDIASLPTTAPWRASYLGPVVLAQKGVPFYPEYINALPVGGNVQQNLPIDMTLDWANPLNIDCLPVLDPLTGLYNYTELACGVIPYMGPIPIATHLHGGEVSPAYDGGPDAWFTPGNLQTGPGWPGAVYTYLNDQQESTIWFHDHALGITRLNVYAGLAGVYPIIDPGGPTAPIATMPAFPQHDIPLIIQDRSFDLDGQIFYNLASNPQPNPTVHPFWIPEFIGDTICVNGKTWPFLDVEPRQYRFRLVNGSNARFYDLTLNNEANPLITYPFIAIATDDGYLLNAVSTPNVIIGPGERYEVIVDFSSLDVDTQVIMMNSANTPFPGGAPVTTGTTDTVMKFIVVTDTSALPNTFIANGTELRNPVANPIQPIANAHDPATGSITRQLTLNEVIGPGGPLELVVNNSKFNLGLLTPGCPGPVPMCRETELPAVGDTEIWEIINISADAHPMHLHLTSFQVLDRTPFAAATWITQYDALLTANGVLPGGGPPNLYYVQNADGAIGGNPAINAFLDMANRTFPLPYELGWKDTVIAYPGEVTRIAVRWDTTDTPVTVGPSAVGTSNYPFDPTILTGGVGYVWHCHIMDHEDNEMMRNYVVGTARQPVVAYAASPDLDGDGCVGRADYTILILAIRSRSTDLQYDLNGDGVVNILDARKLVLSFTHPTGICP